MIVALSCMAQLQADWWSHVMLIGNNNGVWNVLLRLSSNNLWTDFKKTENNPKKVIIAAHALSEQLGNNYYQIPTTTLSDHVKQYTSKTYGSENFVHFVVVPFTPSDELNAQAKTQHSKKFIWIPLHDLLNEGIVIDHYPLDQDIPDILNKNIDYIIDYANGTLHSPVLQPVSSQSIPVQEGWYTHNAIFFYESGLPYYEFTNFYQFPVKIDGKVWPTTEHYYQAQKFTDNSLQEEIRKLRSPRDAFDFTRTVNYAVRPDWRSVNLNIMLKAVRAKFTQNPTLKNLLLNTDDKILVENAGKNDDFFGAGADFNGHNHLGQILMQVREEFRGAPEHKTYTSHPASYYMQKPPQQQPPQPVQPPVPEDLVLQLQMLAQALKNVECLLAPKTEEGCLIS